MDSFLGGLAKGPRTFVACNNCPTPADQVESLQRYVDTTSDEPTESLRPHTNMADDDGQGSTRAGIFITKEELEECTKKAALMAITETMATDSTPAKSNGADKSGAKEATSDSRNVSTKDGDNREGQNNQKGHQNVVNNRYTRPEGQQQQGNRNYQGAQNYNDGRRETRTCYHCGTPGHLMANCRKRGQNVQKNQRKDNRGRPQNQNFQ